MSENNAIVDQSADKEYFILTPQLVWALSRDVYDFTLWNVIKMIAGNDGECFLTTRNLAIMAMMSVGRVCECRAHLLKVGLLEGELRQDEGQQLPVWHLRVPNLWQRNIAWRTEYHAIPKRIDWKLEQKKKKWEDGAEKRQKERERKRKAKEMVHTVNGIEGDTNCSHCEQTPSHCEQTPSHCEPKKNHKEEPIEEPIILRQKSGADELAEGAGAISACADETPPAVNWDEFDDDDTEEQRANLWRKPQQAREVEVLAACGRTRYDTTEELEAIQDILYQVSSGALSEGYLKSRLWCARKHKWSLDTLIKSTLNPESLAKWESERKKKKRRKPTTVESDSTL